MNSESTNEAWDRFADALALCVGDLNEDEYLIISHKRFNYYVQFAGQGQFGMRAEAACNEYIKGFGAELSTEDYRSMMALGWRVPTQLPEAPRDPDGSPNFFVDVSPPVDFSHLARLTTATFRRIYHAGHPGELEYKAFTSDEEPIRFPTLRLKRADS